MEYQALYRKYRPQRFDEVVGQDHVTQTLGREIVDGKVAHAYLFAGPRGTGKTTSARLLAKALNCQNRTTGPEPCNVCDSCIDIAAGTALDVIELDAASHNKVDDIREMRINVSTVAAGENASRVYILDEAHMLSRAAGNALLKTLEEPPSHVVFVLATTEPYKLLDTIRSRAQRFDFHPVAHDVLADYLAEIARREGFEANSAALAAVATHARGSVRDAMSLIEQVAALGAGKVDVSGVTRALGIADQDAFNRLASAVVANDAPGALGLVAELAAQGADLRRFAADAVGFFRGIFLAQYSPNLEEVVDEPAEILAQWRNQAKEMPPADVLRAVDHLGDALMHLRQGREERLVLELAVLRLARPDTSIDPSSLGARIARIEDRLRRADAVPAAPTSEAPAPAPAEEAATPPAATPSAVTPPAVTQPATTPSVETQTVASDPAASDQASAEVPEPDADDPVDEEPEAEAAEVVELAAVDLASIKQIWPAVVATMRERAGPSRHALLKEASPVAVDGNVVMFDVPDHLTFHLERLREDTSLHAKVVEAIKEMADASVTMVFQAAEAEEADEPALVAVPDKADLEDAPASAEDPEALVIDMLSGEVVTD
ncbi:MAG: DNA polymerase III subunit gamma/tau [Acidimicrobiia bacterium]|nr:DNA polymerase III subunit gamma/tau [Acidimicrobiia bacterium]